MKFTSLILISMISLFVSHGFADSNCSVVQVESADPKLSVRMFGNAFAISTTELVVNDHTLAQDAKSVQLFDPASQAVIPALVVHRSYHLDLAVLKVSQTTRLRPCNLSNQPVANGDSLNVASLQKGSRSINVIGARVIDNRSQRIRVPGVTDAIEVTASDLASLREGRSGGTLSDSVGVVGLLSQRTDEGTALAIPASIIANYVIGVRAKSIRNVQYIVDSRSREVFFNGLKFSLGAVTQLAMSESGSGNPHGIAESGSGNPHGFKGPPGSNQHVYSINASDEDPGFAVCDVVSTQLLKMSQADVAKSILDAQASMIFIGAIDGRAVTSNFDLLRALGSCTECKITSYWLKAKDSSALSGSEQATNAQVALLITEIVQTPASDVDYLNESIRLLRAFRALNQKNAVGSNGLVNPAQTQALKQAWDAADNQVSKKFLSPVALDLVESIREAVYAR